MTASTESSLFRAIFDSSLDAILLTSPDGQIFAANPAAEALFGRSEAELVEGGRTSIVDASDPRLAVALRERERLGRFRGDLRLLRPDGTTFEAEFSSVVFRDAAGERRTSMIVRDVSERIRALEEARESEARFQALAAAAFDAVVIHDAGRVLEANRAACELWGYEEAELRTMEVADLAPPEHAEQIRRMIGTASEAPYEAAILTARGEVVPVEASGRAISFHGRPARVVSVRDVTVQRRATRLLEEQNERLRELDALKNEFLALVSHELRTPLTSIVAHVAVLEGGEAGPLDERQRRYLEVVSRNATRLRRLVDDLLFVARAEAGRFEIDRRPVELGSLVEEVVEASKPAAVAAAVSLRATVAAAPVVDADRDRIVQLLDNLVENALKFTPGGGSVEVAVRQEGDEAVVAVVDTGAGIPPEDQPHLFDRFYRRPGTAARTAGAGLGLAIVYEIVAAHGGTVSVASEVGHGTTFTVRLPLCA